MAKNQYNTTSLTPPAGSPGSIAGNPGDRDSEQIFRNTLTAQAAERQKAEQERMAGIQQQQQALAAELTKRSQGQNLQTDTNLAKALPQQEQMATAAAVSQRGGRPGMGLLGAQRQIASGAQGLENQASINRLKEQESAQNALAAVTGQQANTALQAQQMTDAYNISTLGQTAGSIGRETGIGFGTASAQIQADLQAQLAAQSAQAQRDAARKNRQGAIAGGVLGASGAVIGGIYGGAGGAAAGSQIGQAAGQAAYG